MRIAVAAAAPNEPPTVRITVLMPVAIPTSDCATASTIRFAIAANANVMPAPSRMPPSTSSHGCAWANVLIRNEAVIITAPRLSSARKPIRPAIRVAGGPANSCASAVGISSSPASVTVKPKP